MAQEIRQFTVAIPAGTPKNAPVSIPVAFPAREVVGVEIRVPPGPNGLVGFALQVSGVTIIPYGSDQFIVTSGDQLNWALQDYPNSGDWQVIGYNLGVLPHNIYVRFLLNLVPARPTAPAGPAATLGDLTSYDPANIGAVAAIADTTAGLDVTDTAALDAALAQAGDLAAGGGA